VVFVDVRNWKIDKKLIENLSKIARVRLTEQEKEKFLKQMSRILDAFNDIDSADTEGVQPSFHPQELKNVWREDEVVPFEWNPLSNAKNKEGRYFKGPKII